MQKWVEQVQCTKRNFDQTQGKCQSCVPHDPNLGGSFVFPYTDHMIKTYDQTMVLHAWNHGKHVLHGSNNIDIFLSNNMSLTQAKRCNCDRKVVNPCQKRQFIAHFMWLFTRTKNQCNWGRFKLIKVEFFFLLLMGLLVVPVWTTKCTA